MIKEELKQEAEESAKKFFGKPTDLVDLDNLRIFKNAYLAGAEPREKRIAEFEKSCEETQELLDKQIEVTYKLDKENAELKKQNKILSKALNLYINWADECGIAWDNFPDMTEKWYKIVEEKGLGWIAGLTFMVMEEAKEQLASEVEK